jgi:hypothetical protein
MVGSCRCSPDPTSVDAGAEIRLRASRTDKKPGSDKRSDYIEPLPFGEATAIGLLQEMSLGFNEDDAFFELTKFDGQKIRIFDGKVVPVVA